MRSPSPLRRPHRALGLALALAVLPGPAPAAPAAAGSSTPTVRPASPVAGEPVRVLGTVPTRVRRPVAVQGYDGDGWSVLARGRTDRRGAYTVRTALSLSTTSVRTVAKRVRVDGRTYRSWVSPRRSLVVQPPAPEVSAALVTIGHDGSPADGSSSYPRISGDGRFVVFDSLATNLVPGDTNGVSDVFLHDLQAGTTVRVSETPDGVGGDLHSTRADVSDDGEWVVFTSSATNLGWSGGTGNDVLLWQRSTGEITPVSPPRGEGEDFSGVDGPPRISGDGSTVAWVTDDDSLPGDGNTVKDAFAWDRASGQIRLVSHGPALEGGGYRSASYHTDGIASISTDGRTVAFESRAGNLVDGVPGRACCSLSSDVFLWSRFGDEEVVELVSRTLDGTQDTGAEDPAVAPDGSEVVFLSHDPMVEGDGGARDLWRWDADAAAGEEYAWLTEPVLPGTDRGDSYYAEHTGGAVVFASDDEHLTGQVDDNDALDVFRWTPGGGIELVSAGPDGTTAEGASGRVDGSADGSVVVFASRATDLSTDDADDLDQDVFVVTY